MRYRIHIGDSYGIGHNGPCSGPPPGSYRNTACCRKVDIIPDHKKVVHKAHFFDNTKLIVEPFLYFFLYLSIPLLQPFLTKLLQVALGSIAFRNLIFRQVIFSELNFHLTALRNARRIL